MYVDLSDQAAYTHVNIAKIMRLFPFYKYPKSPTLYIALPKYSE